TRLTDRLRRVVATVAADGTLQAGAMRGSIHQIGAALSNAPSCNGWVFWHFERDGKLVALDALRAEEVLRALEQRASEGKEERASRQSDAEVRSE
ncbi:MAG: hypothetical protein ACREFJ_10305, partial [Acetobacteraceae bacterium]